MDIFEEIEVGDCPKCGGPAMLDEECGCGYYVICNDCGAQTVVVNFHSEEDRLLAAKRAAELWNFGKAITSHPGE